ncbi:PREDICTED: uncharacterized protein At3g49720-like isoform X1 [Ipomoea nil]|uniref:uncharacterized protein At3g49720-like isoform X1 n=1 Tax=Ipomoea nil TaxID=35883 RepID=UPI0009012B65|nr:PREDICTED: uncharacterized protein At3g49720-like isoform X1 [Ipomoea nil]
MSRRPINPSRRVAGSGAASLSASVRSKPWSPPYLPIGLVVQGIFLVIGYFYRDSGGDIGAVSRVEGDLSCNIDVQMAIPSLQNTYGDSMHRVLHVGPDTCSVVSKLLTEEDTEAWGVEPYDIEDADRDCRKLVHKGIVRVADIKFPFPYRAKSFSLVIVSDALDYLSPRYLNRTLPELARVSSGGVVVFTGYPHIQKPKNADNPKSAGRHAKRRSETWWIRYFIQTSLEQNDAAIKKFEEAAFKRSYHPSCQVFHLKSYR